MIHFLQLDDFHLPRLAHVWVELDEIQAGFLLVFRDIEVATVNLVKLLVTIAAGAENAPTNAAASGSPTLGLWNDEVHVKSRLEDSNQRAQPNESRLLHSADTAQTLLPCRCSRKPE